MQNPLSTYLCMCRNYDMKVRNTCDLRCVHCRRFFNFFCLRSFLSLTAQCTAGLLELPKKRIEIFLLNRQLLYLILCDRREGVSLCVIETDAQSSVLKSSVLTVPAGGFVASVFTENAMMRASSGQSLKF